MNYIIGCGGVGSWLAPSLCLLVGHDHVTLVDGDTLEDGNLNRQLFTLEDIGACKASTLGNRYNCMAINSYFSYGSVEGLSRADWLICCADNHPCRKTVLDTCDTVGCRAIIACNETHSAEAMLYQRKWKGTDRDPRVYYPEIMTSQQGDPMAIVIGCTGEVQVANRQLVSANFMAAALAQHLYVLWAMESGKFDSEIRDTLLPCRFRANLSKLESIR
jgi:hypothetical protein